MGLDIFHVTPAAESVDSMDYFTIEELHEHPEFLEKHKKLTAFRMYAEDNCEISVIYYDQKGYLRKRVNAEFVSVFENNRLYFDIGTVKKAKLFLVANPGESQDELEKDFQENFIDNFVEGESVFFINW